MTHWWLVVSSEAAVQRPAATIRTARHREAEAIEKPRLPRPKLHRRHSPMAKVESYRRFGIQRIRPGSHFDIELGEVKVSAIQ